MKGKKNKKKKLSLLKVGHQMAQGLYRAGIINSAAMRGLTCCARL